MAEKLKKQKEAEKQAEKLKAEEAMKAMKAEETKITLNQDNFVEELIARTKTHAIQKCHILHANYKGSKFGFTSDTIVSPVLQSDSNVDDKAIISETRAIF